jgi:hypothetical protein
MASAVRTALESLLHARHLDRTLTTARRDDIEYAATGLSALDARLGGGFPRGHVSEVVGARSSGRTSLLLQMLAAATRRGELVALVDALDMGDVDSMKNAGVDLDRLLWVRGHVVTNPGLCRDMNQRALTQALRAFTLILQAGNFGLVALDVAEAPGDAIRRLPFTTWLRLQRIVEGTQIACVLIGSEQAARSSDGLTLRCGDQGSGIGDQGSGIGDRGSGIRDWGGAGARFRGRLFEGLQLEASIVRARVSHDTARVTCLTTAIPHA